MSARKALAAVWRNWIEGRAVDMPRQGDAYQPSAAAQARDALQAQAVDLMRTVVPRLPAHLHGALEQVVLRSTTPPSDAFTLMNQVSTWRTGLGIAHGRGGAPSDEDSLLYEHLGELERWLDHDLGHPEHTQFAVVRRAAERLEGTREPGEAQGVTASDPHPPR